MIRELKTFVAVAREGTFAAAGQQIGLTQAAVSAQMKRLEDELGFTLFDRTGRAARLNRRGQQTLAQAQALIQLYGQLGSRQRTQEPAVFVALGAIASVQQALLPQALVKFHRQLPGSRTRVSPACRPRCSTRWTPAIRRGAHHPPALRATATCVDAAWRASPSPAATRRAAGRLARADRGPALHPL